MSENVPLHPSIVALVSLAANIAANHPKKGLCQLDRLRSMNVSEHQISTVVEIARHIRDEAGDMLDAQYDEQSQDAHDANNKRISEEDEVCCSTTVSGQSCC